VKPLISAVYGARNAIGSQQHQVAGFAPTAVRRKTILTAAERPGTHSKPAESALAADTNGVGPLVSSVPSGLYMRIGTQKTKNKICSRNTGNKTIIHR